MVCEANFFSIKWSSRLVTKQDLLISWILAGVKCGSFIKMDHTQALSFLSQNLCELHYSCQFCTVIVVASYKNRVQKEAVNYVGILLAVFSCFMLKNSIQKYNQLWHTFQNSSLRHVFIRVYLQLLLL
jgi:hypothetical protein